MSVKVVVHLSGNVWLVVLHQPRFPYDKHCGERWSLLSAKKRLSSHERGVCGLKRWDLAQIACRARNNYRMLSSQSQIQGSHTAEIQWFVSWNSAWNIKCPPELPSLTSHCAFQPGKGCSGLKSETVKDRVGRRWGKLCRRDVLFEKSQSESKDNSVSVSFALEGHSKAAVTQQPQAWIIKTFI